MVVEILNKTTAIVAKRNSGKSVMFEWRISQFGSVHVQRLWVSVVPVCESPLSRVSVCACTNGRGGRVQVGGEYNREERKRCDVTIMIAFNSSTLPLLYCWRHIWFTVLPVQSSMPQTVPTDGTRTYYSVRTIVLPCCRQKSKGSQIECPNIWYFGLQILYFADRKSTRLNSSHG